MEVEKTRVNETNLKDYLHIQSIPKQNPDITLNQLRWFVVRRKSLGLSSAIKKIGKRVYFHMPTFLKWVESQET